MSIQHPHVSATDTLALGDGSITYAGWMRLPDLPTFMPSCSRTTFYSPSRARPVAVIKRTLTESMEASGCLARRGPASGWR